MGTRRVVAGIGRTLIGAGVLLLLFVAYQLWGTALAERQAQDALEREFATLLAAPAPAPAAGTSTSTTSPSTTSATVGSSTTTGPVATTATASTVATTVPTTTAAAAAFLSEGDALARLEIPRIDVDKIVVAGVAVDDLRRGPGHYPTTPLPGQVGNAAIAGHRTTYGAPFYRIDELEPGDEILVTTAAGRFRYLVTGQRVVAPTELSVLDPTPTATLTLTACHPRYSARQRLIVTAALEPEPAVAPAVATGPAYTSQTTVDPGEAGVGPDEEPEATDGGAGGGSSGTGGTGGSGGSGQGTQAGGGTGEPGTTPAVSEATVPLTEGWFSDSSAWAPTIAWALACAAAALAAWSLGRRWRRWPSYVLATPVFLVLLYLCFGQLTRLLPPNL